MYKKILLTVDLSDESSWRKALPTAVELCKTFDSAFHLMTVVPDMGLPVVEEFFPDDFEEKMASNAAENLNIVADMARKSDLEVTHHIGSGSIYKEILHIAEDNKIDLIVLASHRPELSDYLLGPNAAKVVRHADCSVLVVRE